MCEEIRICTFISFVNQIFTIVNVPAFRQIFKHALYLQLHRHQEITDGVLRSNKEVL